MKAPEVYNSNKKRLQCRCFRENLAKFLRITFLHNTSGRLLPDFFILLFFAIQWTNRNQIFYIFEHVLSRLSSVMNITSLAFGKRAKQATQRSRRLHMFSKIGVFKIFTNYTGKHLCWSRFSIKLPAWRAAALLKSDSNTGVFLWNF